MPPLAPLLLRVSTLWPLTVPGRPRNQSHHLECLSHHCSPCMCDGRSRRSPLLAPDRRHVPRSLKSVPRCTYEPSWHSNLEALQNGGAQKRTSQRRAVFGPLLAKSLPHRRPSSTSPCINPLAKPLRTSSRCLFPSPPLSPPCNPPAVRQSRFSSHLRVRARARALL